ncbi:3-isopropylmalate dehydratase [Pseudomonas sp.]|uniref:3-isopropylmalate dehydratase n=1 Tax=Pseudomonas sp. TaxID=306 RepID=UPI003A97FE9A
MRLMYAVLPMLVLTGCSSYKTHPDQITQIPEDRMFEYQRAEQDSGNIIINRDMGFIGGGCYVAFKLDRKLAARIGIGETATFSVAPGRHIVGIAIDEEGESLCNNGRLNREVAVTVTKGQDEHFRIVSESSSGFDIRAETPE